jgi:prepilin-type processing-associated H-X9-DG protein
MGILMPALRRVREQAREMVCRSHLNQTTMGALLWSEDHDGWVVGGYWFTGLVVNTNNSEKTQTYDTSLYPYTRAAFLKRQWYNELPSSAAKSRAMAQNNGLYTCPSMNEGMFQSFPGAAEARDDPAESKRFAQQDVQNRFLSYGVNEAAIEGEGGGPGKASKSEDFSWMKEHGYTKVLSINRPGDIVYFMDHLNFEPDMKSCIFDGNVNKIGTYPYTWRWHRNMTSANIGWFDGHVSRTPDDFLQRIRYYYKGQKTDGF